MDVPTPQIHGIHQSSRFAQTSDLISTLLTFIHNPLKLNSTRMVFIKLIEILKYYVINKAHGSQTGKS